MYNILRYKNKQNGEKDIFPIFTINQFLFSSNCHEADLVFGRGLPHNETWVETRSQEY